MHSGETKFWFYALLQASIAWRRADIAASTQDQLALAIQATEAASEQQDGESDGKLDADELDDLTQQAGSQQEQDSETAIDTELQFEAAVQDEPAAASEQPATEEEQVLAEQAMLSMPEDTTEQLTASPAVRQATPQDQRKKNAAALSKELRKLQAETTVLQEHSRRLQEKAAVIQQQRAADQAGFLANIGMDTFAVHICKWQKQCLS